MTPKERVLAVLRGNQADRIPFTIYEGLLPRGEKERYLRNEGIGLVRHCPVCCEEHPNVEISRKEYRKGEERIIRETMSTPVGKVWQTFKLSEAEYGNVWRLDFYIKKPSDYKVIEFVIKDKIYYPNYENFLKAEKELGEDGIVIPWTDRSPMQKILTEFMGVERFSIDFFEEKKLFHSLYELIKEKQKRLFKITANSSAKVVDCGDNITGDIIGSKRFNRYYILWYNEYAQQLHKKGKLLAVHMDGKLNCLKEAIANSEIDIIEAFTPPPIGDLSLKEAYSLWKDKLIWINYTSSMHLSSPEKIRDHTLSLLGEVLPGNRFLVGVTEDIPDTVRNRSLTAIARTVKRYGLLPLNLGKEIKTRNE